MSRLYDRVMAYGCQPLTAGHIHAASETPESRRMMLEEIAASGHPIADDRLDAMLVHVRSDLEQHESPHRLDAAVSSAVVLSAEESADYWSALPGHTNITDLVATVVPPFDSMFVEFQHRPNVLSCESWGVLFHGEQIPDGWVIHGELVAEWTKRRPIGPVARWVLPLDAEGMLAQGDSEGYGSIFLQPSEVPTVPADAQFDYGNGLARLLAPALFAISLMHCKNVDIREVEPPDRLSRRHERKHGRPLTRYYVLDVQPMRRVLDAEGEAQSKGLGHALHICRGHFKTYGEDAPLLGRHVGTYWWPSHVRGAAEEGVVEKDYRIRLDQGLGREYRDADEHPEIRVDASEHTGLDPDLGGRGLRAHNVTQNQLAEAVRAAGYGPRRPRPDEPQYDLAWEANEVVWVAEVKSITAQNEERQLRLGLGQVVRYRQLLDGEGRTVRAVIATEREPSDPSWADLLAEQEIMLVWPGTMRIT